MAEQAPSERELEILKVLWEIGSASVRDVHRRMCPNNELAFNTVQTVLRIMTKKELVTQRPEGQAMIYTPAYTREQVTRRFLRKVYDGASRYVARALEQRVAHYAYGDSTAKRRDLQYDAPLRKALDLLDKGASQRDLFAMAGEPLTHITAGPKKP